MRLSIKYKLFAVICAVAFAFVAMLTVLNVFFYDDYYQYERRRALADIYREMHSSYSGAVADVSARLEQLENETGVRLSILSGDGAIKYDSIFREQRALLSTVIPKRIINLYDFPLDGATLTEQNLVDLQQQGYTYTVIENGHGSAQEEQSGFLCLIGLLADEQEMLIARVPLSYMAQNSSFNLTFLSITALLTLLVCMLLAYHVSKLFTKPLIEIEGVATAMAGLDFSKQYAGQTSDEIGRLGQNINLLCEHLEQAITALQTTNEELAHEIEEKERIDSMRQEFIANVSHELKTPIALIQGYAEGLRVGITTSKADHDFYCDTISDEAQRMNQLVMQLLDLSKLELGRDTPEPSEVDVYALCKKVADKAVVLADERGLSVQYAETKAVMWADYGMAEQVVTNFLSNAIRYTPFGGKITLSAWTDTNGVTLCVENEGEGIAEHELALVFEKFYRTDKARTRESGGSGIGLSIVRAVADAHRGACGAQNVPGGVRFWFRVPNRYDLHR